MTAAQQVASGVTCLTKYHFRFIENIFVKLTNSVFQLGMRNVQAPKQQQTSKSRKFKMNRRNYANCEKILSNLLQLLLAKQPNPLSAQISFQAFTFNNYYTRLLELYTDRPEQNKEMYKLDKEPDFNIFKLKLKWR